MSTTTTIHELPAAWRADPEANAEGCARQLEELLPAVLQNECELGDLHFVMERQRPWNAKAQAMLDPSRWAGRSYIEFAVTELEEARARIAELNAELRTARMCYEGSEDACTKLGAELEKRDRRNAQTIAELNETQAMLSKEQRWRIKAEEPPQAELDKLRLDVAELTGRLKERQMAALQRENRLLEQVRDLRKVAEEALSLLKDLSDCFESSGYRWEWQESGRRIRAHIESWRMRLNAVPTQTGTTEGGAA